MRSAPIGAAALPPAGFELVLDRQTRWVGERAVLGGRPLRLLQLAPRAASMLDGRRLVVSDRRSALFARRLLDTGVAHPRLAPSARSAEVTVVVPVKDRPAALGRLLASLASSPAPVAGVVVVDDGSVDPTAVARVTAAGGALLRRHRASRGPAAARNTGLRAATTPFVAFVDSDCAVSDGWLETLLAHFADPTVALVAPRVVSWPAPAGRGDWLCAYEHVRSSLDLGADEAVLVRGGRISWLPGAAMVARRDALGDGFDEALRAGEDVDLVWRLADAGWRVRYEPAARVTHEHRTSWRAWAGRKFVYGTGAGVLASRHGSRVAPVVLPGWALACWSLALVPRRQALAAAVPVAAVEPLARRLAGTERPRMLAASLVARGVVDSGFQLASALVRCWWPLSLLAAARWRGARRVVAVAAVCDAAADWLARRPALDPARFFVARRFEDLAYGAGLWWGAWRERSMLPLAPQVVITYTGTGASRSGHRAVPHT